MKQLYKKDGQCNSDIAKKKTIKIIIVIYAKPGTYRV